MPQKTQPTEPTSTSNTVANKLKPEQTPAAAELIVRSLAMNAITAVGFSKIFGETRSHRMRHGVGGGNSQGKGRRSRRFPVQTNVDGYRADQIIYDFNGQVRVMLGDDN
jgi:hypothetical protein